MLWQTLGKGVPQWLIWKWVCKWQVTFPLLWKCWCKNRSKNCLRNHKKSRHQWHSYARNSVGVLLGAQWTMDNGQSGQGSLLPTKHSLQVQRCWNPPIGYGRRHHKCEQRGKYSKNQYSDKHICRKEETKTSKGQMPQNTSWKRTPTMSRAGGTLVRFPNPLPRASESENLTRQCLVLEVSETGTPRTMNWSKDEISRVKMF